MRALSESQQNACQDGTTYISQLNAHALPLPQIGDYSGSVALPCAHQQASAAIAGVSIFHNHDAPMALIVDDDSFMRFMARDVLERAGLHVREAGNGIAGLSAIAEFRPDIVLLDAVMPGMDGFTLCREIRKLTSGQFIPILMITGLNDIESISLAYSAGATDFIIKPVTEAILAHRVQYMLSANQALISLAKSDAKLRIAQSISSIGSWEWDIIADRATWSDEMFRICGLSLGDFDGTYEGFLGIVHPEDKSLVEVSVRETLENGVPYSVEHRIIRPDQSVRNVHGRAALLNDAEHKPRIMHGTLQDITERKHAEALIIDSEARLASVLNSIENAVWSIDATTHKIISLNRAGEIILDRKLVDFKNNPELWFNIIYIEDVQRVRSSYLKLSETNMLALEYRITCHDGSLRWLESRTKVTCDSQGRPLFFDGIITDITDRKNNEMRISRLANYDTLTDLPNRNLLGDRLTQSIAQARRTGQFLALLCLDLDGFKFINDSFGHAHGDALLKSVAIRLQETIRECDTVARLSGDEFVILLPGLPDAEIAGIIAKKILVALSQPLKVEHNELRITGSIGISVFPQDGDTGDALLQHADAAMYGAKRKGYDCVQFYMREMGAYAEHRVTLDSALRHAIEYEEFEVHYQPKVELRSGRIIGAEALIRWNRPGHGLVSPDCFIPLAEELGLIVPIGEWVLSNACAQVKSWHDMGHTDLSVAVNLSVRQCWRQDLPVVIGKILTNAGLSANHVELEITESTLMNDASSMVAILRRLKDLGTLLTLDDFGTGYSSLSYLKKFPIDVLKIDRSFIEDVTTNASDAALTKAIILMAQSLKLKTVAEGVETEAQLGFLKSNRCDAMQGYYFSKPVAAPVFKEMLRQGKHIPGIADAPEAKNTLLILDDEPNVASSLGRLFRQDRYDVLLAHTAEEAFEQLALHPVQVIISDQRMPMMTGMEFFSKVKDMYPNTIRILLSGYTDLASIIDVINSGAIYRFFTKPWDDNMLRENIRQAFHYHWLAHRPSDGGIYSA